MNITSNLLGELARANQLSAPSIFETVLEIPRVIQGVIELGNSIDSATIDITKTQNTSFISGIEQSVVNGGLASINVGILAAGIWDIEISATYSSNYSTGIGLGWRLFFLIGTFSSILINMFTVPALGGSLVTTRRFKITSAQVVTLNPQLAANGAAQAHHAAVNVIARRLL